MRSFVALLLLIAPFHSLAIPPPLVDKPFVDSLQNDIDFIKTKCYVENIEGGSAIAQRRRLYCLNLIFEYAIRVAEPSSPGSRGSYEDWATSGLLFWGSYCILVLFSNYLRLSTDGESASLKWREAKDREGIMLVDWLDTKDSREIISESFWVTEQIPTSQSIIIAYKYGLLRHIQSEEEGKILWKLVSNAMVILLHSTSSWLWMKENGYIRTSKYDIGKKLTELNEYALHELAFTFSGKGGGTLGRMSTKAIPEE